MFVTGIAMILSPIYICLRGQSYTIFLSYKTIGDKKLKKSFFSRKERRGTQGKEDILEGGEQEVVVEGVIARLEFELPGEAVRLDGGEHLGEEMLDLLVLFCRKSRKVLTVVAIETEEVEPTVVLVEGEQFLAVREGEPCELPLHGEVGKQVVETSDGTGVGEGCGVLAVVVSSLAKDDERGMEVVQTSGVVVAVEAAGGIERETLVDGGFDHIESVERPVEAKAESLFPTPLGRGASDGIEHFGAIGFVVLNELEDGTLGMGLPKGRVGLLQSVGGKPVVGIEHGDVFPSGKLESEVSGDGLTAVDGGMEHLKAGVGCGILLQDGRGRVGGAVVDTDELAVGKGLSAKGIEALPQVAFGVVHRREDCHFRHSRFFSLGRMVVSRFST